MVKIEGSGSISQRHGSEDPDPDPHQNVMDPQHCYLCVCFWKIAVLDILLRIFFVLLPSIHLIAVFFVTSRHRKKREVAGSRNPPPHPAVFLEAFPGRDTSVQDQMSPGGGGGGGGANVLYLSPSFLFPFSVAKRKVFFLCPPNGQTGQILSSR
jgi:hypothetical protein